MVEADVESSILMRVEALLGRPAAMASLPCCAGKCLGRMPTRRTVSASFNMGEKTMILIKITLVLLPQMTCD